MFNQYRGFFVDKFVVQLCTPVICFDWTMCSYDPAVSVEMAWKIDGKSVKRVDNIRSIASVADYVSIHVPFIEGVTENLISDDFFMHMKVRTRSPLLCRSEC